MSYFVELRDQAGSRIGSPQNILDVASPYLEKRFGKDWRRADPPILLLYPYSNENNDLQGHRPLSYQSQALGIIQVSIADHGRLRYHHPHLVSEVLGPGLRQWLDLLEPDATPASYRITGPGIEKLLSQAAPIPKWVTEVAPYAPGEQPSFRIRPIPPPPPDPASLAQFSARAAEPGWADQPEHSDFIEVLISPELEKNLLQDRPFSAKVEEGGFLLGQIYQNQERPGSFIAHLLDAVPAEQVGASFLHFTFTGDSFDRIKQRLISSHQGQRLLGWYHTHLFPANETMGLSSIDLDLHFTTFRIPWQLAGLLNLDRHSRVLRFYVRHANSMALCHHQTSPAPSAGSK